MGGWEPLRVGDSVDVIAPGFRTTDEKVKGACQFLEQIGLKARIPLDLFGPDVICSQTDAIRWRHLREALTNSKSQAIWCLRGGYGSIRIIEQLAKLPKPKKHKLFIGYSDAVTIHNHLNQFWKRSSLHGPLLDRLGQQDLPIEQVQGLLDLVFGRSEEVRFNGLRPLNKAAASRKKILASVVGGNLKVVESALGTPYYRAPKKQMVFFEDIGERGYRVDRMLKHLLLAGYFRHVTAVLFGEFIEGKEADGESLVPAVIERFAQEVKIPVFSGLPIGHGVNQRPLPFLTPAVLQCGQEGQLSVKSGAKL